MSGPLGNQLVKFDSWENKTNFLAPDMTLRPCLHGVGDPGLVG